MNEGSRYLDEQNVKQETPLIGKSLSEWLDPDGQPIKE